ncbi:biotin-dependent carboxyltransferase family protein [Mucilaginibacter flavidus]|uniref:5-oxoprolinase subunit C family protein n=1 Tax=Mucilaginibacter flavidus TaxID=2949309 RepID=UPI002092EC4F|nr:biotin-dependent carboxyltransferase family protein [Mucilaginibacter flavidus]MCO5948811.1 biotin-dependent carboxyltransferase family protein [Mucilaginibacter flavidus]
MKIRILKPGLLSTIQDMGRRHYLSQGVPLSGAMDSLSARIANKAVGNTDDQAVIEFTYADAGFRAETDLLIAYAGDGMRLQCAAQILPPERPVFIPAGTVIQLIHSSIGVHTYLSIAGGWEIPEVLGSRSTCLAASFGGFKGRSLHAGDILSGIGQLSAISASLLRILKNEQINFAKWSIPRQLILPANRKVIRVTPGTEADWFNSQSIVDFFLAPYILGRNSNRMGFRLEGPEIVRTKNDELISTAVTPGTIQVTGSGQMILLMADGQTTGGYPRIAQVASVDLPLCGQLKPGDTVYFKEISQREAEVLYLKREDELSKLTTALKSIFL